MKGLNSLLRKEFGEEPRTRRNDELREKQGEVSPISVSITISRLRTIGDDENNWTSADAISMSMSCGNNGRNHNS